jgi:hypothetical protein
MTMDGDYIELDAADRGVDVVAVLAGLLNPIAISDGETAFPVFTVDARTELFVDDLGEGRACLAIANLDGDDGFRWMAARQVYTVLARHTRWSLRWSTDGRAQASGVPDQRVEVQNPTRTRSLGPAG